MPRDAANTIHYNAHGCWICFFSFFFSVPCELCAEMNMFIIVITIIIMIVMIMMVKHAAFLTVTTMNYIFTALETRKRCMPKPRESKWCIILLTKSFFFIIIIFFPLYTNCLVYDWKLKVPFHVMCSFVRLSLSLPRSETATKTAKNFFFSSMKCVFSTCVHSHMLWFNN